MEKGACRDDRRLYRRMAQIPVILRARSIESDEALPFDARAKEQIDPLGTKCAQTIDKVMLAFGKTTECGKAAAELDEEIWNLKQVVLKTPTGWDATTKRAIAVLLNGVNDAHKEFVEKAHIACQPTRWQEPKGETTTKTPASGGIELGSSGRGVGGSPLPLPFPGDVLRTRLEHKLGSDTAETS